MPRLQDIAAKAGVSVTTVSHVLNNSRPVRPETAERVLKAVRELDYKPNILARSLRRRETRTIGLLVSDIENPYFTELARAVEKTAYDCGYNVILCNTDENLNKEILYVEVLFAKQVDGLIIAPAPGDHSFLRPYLGRGSVIVFVNRTVKDIEAPAIVADDENAMFTLACQLLSNGHRRLGAIIGLETVSTTINRLRGLSRALELYGLTMNDIWLFPGEARYEGGYKAAHALSHLAYPPTCVVCFNSVMLDGLLLGLTTIAPRFIREIEITGFGYSLVAHVCQTSSLYVAQPARQIGETATHLLLDILSGKMPRTADTIVLANTITTFPCSPTSPMYTEPSDKIQAGT